MRPASSCVKIVLPLEAFFFFVVVVVKFLESVLRVFVQSVLSLMLVDQLSAPRNVGFQISH